MDADDKNQADYVHQAHNWLKLVIVCYCMLIWTTTTKVMTNLWVRFGTQTLVMIIMMTWMTNMEMTIEDSDKDDYDDDDDDDNDDDNNKVDDDDDDGLTQVNLLGQVWVLREFLPSMIKMNRLGPVSYDDDDVDDDLHHHIGHEDFDDDGADEEEKILWGGEHFS